MYAPSSGRGGPSDLRLITLHPSAVATRQLVVPVERKGGLSDSLRTRTNMQRAARRPRKKRFHALMQG
jgi:hypothetical protein